METIDHCAAAPQSKRLSLCVLPAPSSLTTELTETLSGEVFVKQRAHSNSRKIRLRPSMRWFHQWRFATFASAFQVTRTMWFC
jgi:hypothetical protein